MQISQIDLEQKPAVHQKPNAKVLFQFFDGSPMSEP